MGLHDLQQACRPIIENCEVVYRHQASCIAVPNDKRTPHTDSVYKPPSPISPITATSMLLAAQQGSQTSIVATQPPELDMHHHRRAICTLVCSSPNILSQCEAAAIHTDKSGFSSTPQFLTGHGSFQVGPGPFAPSSPRAAVC